MIDDPTRRTALIGGAALLAGVAAPALAPRRYDGARFRTPLARLVPATLGPWRSEAAGSGAGIVMPELDLSSMYDLAFSRAYGRPGEPAMMVVIVHGGTQSTSWRVHRPEYCYEGQGFTLAGIHDARWTLPGGVTVPGRLMTATRGDRVEQVGYWRRIADDFPVGAVEERMVALRRLLAGRIPDGTLVRLSTITPDAGWAAAAFQAFASALVAGSGAQARAIMLGAPRGTVTQKA